MIDDTTDGWQIHMASAPKQHRSGKANRRAYDRHRPSSTARGYNYKWEQYSKQYRKNHPLCVECEKDGIPNAGTERQPNEVDHIQPVQGQSDPMFWQPSNHQTLCKTHHSRKTATEVNGQQIRREKR